MLTRSRRFFASTVDPTVSEFWQQPRDVRRGRLATIVLYHMADYWWADDKMAYPDLTTLQLHLIRICPDFSIIRDVADASKHAELVSSQKRIPRTLSNADQISRQPGIFEAPFNTAVFNEASYVFVQLNDGTERPLLGAIRSTLDMWKSLLA